jgi:hypothetical protein
MKYLTLIVIALFARVNCEERPQLISPAITYSLSGGRLGDNLLAYISALHFSYHYQLPLLFKNFPYADNLKLSGYGLKELSSKASTYVFDQFSIFSAKELINKKEIDLFVLPFGVPYKIDIKDQKFKELARSLINPIKELNLFDPPNNSLNVALHWREGGGFDPVGWHLTFPLKCPGQEFYIEALNYILNSFDNKKIFCYVFTDAKNPIELVEILRKEFRHNEQISFECRKEKNRHDLNVLEDFFQLMKFDILIRPQSALSIVASLLQDYLLVCEPISYEIVNDKVVIDCIKYTRLNERDES